MTQKLRKLNTLITKAQKGDRHAYSLIVKQFQDLAVGYAYSILKNFPLAEEAAQEAFIEAYLNLNRLQKPAAFPGWLKKIVFKQCNRITRKKCPPFTSLTQIGELISSQSSPTNIAEQKELQDRIQEAIAQLGGNRRFVQRSAASEKMYFFIPFFGLNDKKYKSLLCLVCFLLGKVS